MRQIILIYLLLPGTILAQTWEVKGTILDAATKKPLPYASILLSGTNTGSVSNLDGDFIFKLTVGEHLLITKYIGYKTDSVNIFVPTTRNIVISLIKQPILLPEVLVTSEDPAYRIIKEAIKRKSINNKGLNNYEYSSYLKNVMESDGVIALVQEMIIKSYRLKDNKTKEFILETHRTVNQKKIPNFNIAADLTDKHMPDFSADTLRLMMNTVYLPIADNAFDYYDYKLLKTIGTPDAPVYEIRVLPRSSIQPLLEGVIYIEGENYSIVKIDLKASKGVRFPYIHDLKIDFKQSLGKFNGYRLPYYFEMDASMGFSFQGLIGIAPVSLHEVNSITEYKINQPVPDSVNKSVMSNYGGYVSDSTKRKMPPKEISSAEMKSLRPVPLSVSEVKAYATIDTTMTLEKSIKFTGAFAGLASKASGNESNSGNKSNFGQSVFGQIGRIMLNYIYLNNNRVENLTFGIKYNSDIFDKNIYTNSYAAYSTGMKDKLWSFALGYRFGNYFLTGIELEAFRKVQEWQAFNPFSHIINSASILIGYKDYYNYYLSSGYSVGIIKNSGNYFSTSLNFISERQSSLQEKKYLSIINSGRKLRINPLIDEGLDRKIRFYLQLGNSPLEIQIVPSDGLITYIDFSQHYLNSDFSYFKIFSACQLRINTFYPELFLSPYLQFNVEAGYIKGNYGIQQVISPISSMGFYSPATSFKGLRPYQLAGDKMIAIHIEHNWRTIIFQSLGADFLANSDLDIITGAAALRIFNDSNYLPQLTQRDLYWEVYTCVSRILGLINLQLSYNSFKNYTVTVSVAPLF